VTDDEEANGGETLSERIRIYFSAAMAMLTRHWFAFASYAVIVAALIAWFLLFLPSAGVDSARWTLSALVQGAAAILGTTFVGFTFVWNEAERSIDQLRRLRPEFVSRLAAQTNDWKTTDGEGKPVSALVSDLERMRRLIVQKMRDGEFRDDDDLLLYTEYDSHADHLIEISALCKALLAMTFMDPHWEQRERIDNDLRTAGVSEDEIAVDMYWREGDIKANPVEFFDVATDIFSITNFVPPNVDEECGRFLDEIVEMTERDDIDGFLRRIKLMRRMRRGPFKLTMLLLIAAVAWGLIVLSGYSQSTAEIALVVPILLALAGLNFLAALASVIISE